MMWDVVDLRKNLNKLEEKHAYVKWWAKRPELDLILEKLDVNFEDIKDALDIKDDLYCIYVGQSIDRAIAGYLSMQFNQKSTFRISLSSIISLRQFDREAVNNFLDKLKIEIFTIDLPVKSEEAKMELTNSVNNCLEKNFYILNIKGNNHPLSSNISKKLSKIRKQAKQNEELYSKSDIKNLKKDNINTSNKIVKEDKNMWFVAAGESSSKIDLFRMNNCIAIGWNVGNVKGKSKKDIDKKYAFKYPNDNNRQKGQAVSQINNFVNNINIEEYVITSDNVKKQYLLGKCISDYYFSDKLDEDIEDQYEHFRDVEWLCTIDWDDISEEVKKYISSNSVRRINKISNEFLDFIKVIPSFSNSEKRNKIYFGAPGTGKSFTLKENVKTLLGENEENYERVTFHPDYTYANFVGTYKPVPKGKDITYEYVPGPFMRILIKALHNPFEPFVLIIEEINRANVAAVFGDVFQLLDRDHRENISEYPINASEDLKNYLKNELKNMKIPDKNRCGLRKYWKSLLGQEYDKIKIPSNMFIWATMNSADQGVFPMDTAFKRRWDFEYFDINHGETNLKNIEINLNDKKFKWNSIRKAINNQLIEYKINEDKLLGPFFAFDDLDENSSESKLKKEFKEIFKNKILMYLFEDVARSKRTLLFQGTMENLKIKDNITYYQIRNDFEDNELKIFSKKIREELKLGE